jgi:hypothetical protein
VVGGQWSVAGVAGSKLKLELRAPYLGITGLGLRDNLLWQRTNLENSADFTAG